MLKIAVLTLVLILAGGCEDTRITTDVDADGSCRRTVVVKSDSEDIFDTAYPVPRDESWEISTEWTQEKNRKHFIYTATKSFDTVEEMAREIENQHPLDSHIQVSMTQEWRGFFTHYTYREVYADIFPFKQYPLSEAFSVEEIDLIRRQLAEEEGLEETVPKEKLKDLEERFKRWFLRATFEEYYSILVNAVKKMERPEISAAELERGKEELFEKSFKNQEMLEEVKLEKAIEATAALWGESFARGILDHFREDFELYERKFRIIDGLVGDSFTNNVRMPGIITAANTDILEGNMATWKFGPTNFMFQEYEMTVESRKLNWWTVVGGGSVVLALVIILLFTSARRQS